MKLWIMWMIDAIFNSIFAGITKEAGWINSAIQLWLVTLSFYIIEIG